MVFVVVEIGGDPAVAVEGWIQSTVGRQAGHHEMIGICLRSAGHDDPAKTGMVRLRIYDVAGRLVRTLADGAHPAGRHEVVWNGTDHAGRRVAAGVYFARLDSGGIHVQRSITVLR